MQSRLRQLRGIWLAAGAVVLAALIVALLAWSGGPVLGQSLTIGYVDMPKVLDSHPRRQASERALQEFFQAKQREFQQKARTMTPVQRQELDRRLQQEFLQRREQLLGGLDKDIRAAVEKVARDRGIGIVLDRTVVLFGGTDLTEAVIAQLTGK